MENRRGGKLHFLPSVPCKATIALLFVAFPAFLYDSEAARFEQEREKKNLLKHFRDIININ